LSETLINHPPQYLKNIGGYFSFMKVLISIIFCFNFCKLFAQDLKLPIKIENGFDQFTHFGIPVHWITEESRYRNCVSNIKKPTNIADIKVGLIIFQTAQFIYQNFNLGNISATDFLSLKKELNWNPDTSRLIKKNILCYCIVLYGKDNNSKFVYIIDKNDNQDFSDDPQIEPSDETINDYELTFIKCERFIHGTIFSDNAPLFFTKKNDNLYYNISEFAKANFSLGESLYTIKIKPKYFVNRNFANSDIYFQKANESNFLINDDSLIGTNQIFKIKNLFYKNLGVDQNNTFLNLQVVNEEKKYSNQVGYFVKDIEKTLLINGEALSSMEFNNKFLFINFWGTWCKPCRDEIPYLISTYKQLDTSKILFLNVASSDNKELVLDVVKKYGIIWPQVLSDSLTNKFNITSFPNNILILPNGKIVAKDIKIDDIKKVILEQINNYEFDQKK
jgi:thiol-disulfide isomerase/thioredoxin